MLRTFKALSTYLVQDNKMCTKLDCVDFKAQLGMENDNSHKSVARSI